MRVCGRSCETWANCKCWGCRGIRLRHLHHHQYEQGGAWRDAYVEFENTCGQRPLDSHFCQEFLTDPLPSLTPFPSLRKTCWRDGLRPVPNFRREAPSRGKGAASLRESADTAVSPPIRTKGFAPNTRWARQRRSRGARSPWSAPTSPRGLNLNIHAAAGRWILTPVMNF